jgi:hypothetical protein
MDLSINSDKKERAVEECGKREKWKGFYFRRGGALFC